MIYQWLYLELSSSLSSSLYKIDKNYSSCIYYFLILLLLLLLLLPLIRLVGAVDFPDALGDDDDDELNMHVNKCIDSELLVCTNRYICDVYKQYKITS